MNSKTEFSIRRQKLLAQVDKNDAIILFGASEMLRNGDVHFPFRQNSNFYYYTGYNEPDAVVLLLPSHKDGEYILFNLPKDPLMERWTGTRIGQNEAIKSYGADVAFDIEKLDEQVITLLSGRQKLYYEMGSNMKWDRKVLTWTKMLKERNRKSDNPTNIADIRTLSGEMRLFKDPAEIELLRASAQKSATAHMAAMAQCKPNMYEYHLEAIINYELMNMGCRSQAYPPIVGGGKNACILHYIENNNVLHDGDLVLIDAGGEYKNYASDITRTFPVNGKFSAEQAAVYNVVLKAQTEVIAAIRPGLTWNRLQEITVSHLVQGLVSLGILSGTVLDAINKQNYQHYYMHNVSHWLGLDVHDAGAYKIGDQWRTLKEGMVLTVEPGLYLYANDHLDKKWWNMGIRIEDDILVTATGCEVLSEAVPKEIKDIEQIMAGHKIRDPQFSATIKEGKE